MRKKNNTPENLRGSAGASTVVQYKGSRIFLSKLQSAFFATLSNGQRYSSHKLMQLLHTSDPRKEVQYLRRKGIHVQDEWVEATASTPRHKLYFIDPKECRKVVGDE